MINVEDYALDLDGLTSADRISAAKKFANVLKTTRK